MGLCVFSWRYSSSIVDRRIDYLITAGDEFYGFLGVTICYNHVWVLQRFSCSLSESR